MNMQFGARHRDSHSPFSNSYGPQQDRPASARLRPADANIPSPFPSQTHSETAASSEMHGISPDPDAAYFTAYGPPEHRAHPAEYRSEAGSAREDGPISALHVGLIAMILLAGLAIGVGRAWWIDEKLEAVSTKTPAVASAVAPSPVEEQTPSIQSSMDRAYIPPLLDSDRDAREVDNAATSSVDSGAVSEPEIPIPAEIKSAPAAKSDSESNPSQEPLKAGFDTGKIQAASPQPDKPGAVQAKKRKSESAASSKKLASAPKKERIKEIDRVRTQAFSETSKDRVGERKSAVPDSSIGPQSQRRNSPRTSKVVQNVVTSSQYSRCERIDHIFRREKCKWDLCNNKWGKGACPSFKHERPSVF
jgi:hypothetical protein